VEREILMTGIGGQGVQLAAQILAEAATHAGRHVLSLGTYGGTMRGGNSDATVVVADAPISSPPIVARAWAALVMHPRFAAPSCAKLGPESPLLVDADSAGAELAPTRGRRFDVAAQALAREADAPRAGSLVLLGALCGLTGLVPLEELVAAMERALPDYRSQHRAANARALAAGHAALPAGAEPAWREAAA